MPGAFYNDNGSSFDDRSAAGQASSFDSNASAQDDSDQDRSADYSEDRSSTPTGDRGSSDNEAKKLARSATKFALCSKFTAYLILLLSAVGAAVGAYYITLDQEMDKFESDFDIYAKELIRAVDNTIGFKLEAARGFSIGITSYAQDRGEVFPFVTMPDFELQAQKLLAMFEVDGLFWSPLVSDEQRDAWESYTVVEGPKWILESALAAGVDSLPDTPFLPFIHNAFLENGPPVPVDGPVFTGNEMLSGMYSPAWQGSPFAIVESTGDQVINWDQLRGEDLTFEAIHSAVKHNTPSMHGLDTFQIGPALQEARSMLAIPVASNFSASAEVVGTLGLRVPWEPYFENVLPVHVKGLDVVLGDSCGGLYTLRVSGESVVVRGEGDLHDSEFDSRRYSGTVGSVAGTPGALFYVSGNCVYTLDIYPTDEFEDTYITSDPIFYSVIVGVVFLFTALVFLVYDWAVQMRQNKVMKTATRTQAIVSSLFPKNVQERIFKDVEEQVKMEERGGRVDRRFGNRTKDQLKNFLSDGKAEEAAQGPTSLKSKPIADLFPEATIIFADLVGFTAWSSTREPTQVFTLLETIYASFDEIAKRRRIFKVETVGDCYVAVSGLPEPRKDHAVAMARFARDILHKMREMVKQMVVELGPDTEDLGLRIGIHSGPVTAGVLRGERARFQLFGDTMNTTARMESTGSPNRIQMSQETADLLIAAGKSQWLTARQDRVNAKGKGELQTYWLEVHDDNAAKTITSSTPSQTSSANEETPSSPSKAKPAVSAPKSNHAADKHLRLISWNTDILTRLLTQIIARRESKGIVPDPVDKLHDLEEQVSRTRLCLSEVTEIITLPQFESTANSIDPSRIELSEDVTGQLRDYVQTLAAMYRENPFHNFEHASHVTMSVLKLLSRIVAPADLQSDTDKTLHDHTYGITSDPMTQFAVVLSALIHDADHPGVPNAQLIKENASIASVYKNKSIAEQNSVDLAWDLLMDDAYVDLRRAIYVTEEDFLRFRQLVVNIVLATDIMDKDLGALRKARWNKAFSEQPVDENAEISQNRKATIVMEHLIQASDVAHTMQHWHIYRKWNQRLFLELYKAYAEGRAEKDPSENWYKGEMGFFDFYIIPLAKKLKDCGVFGVSSDEYLQYAQQNRKEWELKGRQVTAEMAEVAKSKGFGSGSRTDVV